MFTLYALEIASDSSQHNLLSQGESLNFSHAPMSYCTNMLMQNPGIDRENFMRIIQHLKTCYPVREGDIYGIPLDLAAKYLECDFLFLTNEIGSQADKDTAGIFTFCDLPEHLKFLRALSPKLQCLKMQYASFLGTATYFKLILDGKSQCTEDMGIEISPKNPHIRYFQTYTPETQNKLKQKFPGIEKLCESVENPGISVQ